MRKVVIGSAGAIALLAMSIGSAHAACDALCRSKCAATAHQGNMTVEQCIRVWSGINARYGSQGARAYEGRVGFSKDGKQRVIVRKANGKYEPLR